jgi:hypothetical protein
LIASTTPPGHFPRRFRRLDISLDGSAWIFNLPSAEIDKQIMANRMDAMAVDSSDDDDVFFSFPDEGSAEGPTGPTLSASVTGEVGGDPRAVCDGEESTDQASSNNCVQE